MIDELSFEQLGAVRGGVDVAVSGLELDVDLNGIANVMKEAAVVMLTIYTCPKLREVNPRVGRWIRLVCVSSLIWVAHSMSNVIFGPINSLRLRIRYNCSDGDDDSAVVTAGDL